MKRKLAVMLLVFAPVLICTMAVVAGSQEVETPTTEELAFNQPSGAMPRVPGEGASTGGFTSDNVEYEGFFRFKKMGELGQPVPANPEILTATGANIRGDYMYLTSWKNVSIYDISKPLSPRLMDIEPLGFKFENENVATNGKILLFSESLPGDALHVYNVANKENIRKMATVKGAGDHTTTCILECRWAYGSDGSITDLRDPRNPELEDRNWHEITGLNEDGAHDVDEYKNGFLITSPISDDFQVLDVREPLKPKVLATGAHPTPVDDFLFHSGTWPRAGEDKFVIMQGEKNFRPECNEQQGPVMTYDKVEGAAPGEPDFALKDTYRVENGTYADGAPAINALGCSAHWFEVHPTWKDGGMMALGYYEHGTHFLKVADDGQITRKGYFVPVAGSTSAAYWINRNIVYAVDYTRGIDILRYTGPGTNGPLTNANQNGTGRG